MATPTSTYRLQFTKDFTFYDATQIVDYLRDLGVDAIYCSPVLQSMPGSNHGYDWVDCDVIDADRGGEEGWARLLAAAKDAGLKVVVDIVPNHMGIAEPQLAKQWWDVLEHGEDSPYAKWFDVDWSAPRIAVPILASDEDFERVELDEAAGQLVYYEHRFPLAPGSWQPGDAPSDVHERQHYELRGWRASDEILNYRRFFTITTLAGLRVDDHDVAAATHRRILRMVREEGIDGLRVDHPDGLARPGDYLRWLRTQCEQAGRDDVWIVIEKILHPGERMPVDWPIAGTTGYDAMTLVNQIFVADDAEHAFTEYFIEQTGGPLIEDAVLDGKRRAAADLFWPERRRLLRLISPALGESEIPAEQLDLALIELAVQVDVYRSYLADCDERADLADVAAPLFAAADRARSARPELGAPIAALLPLLGAPGTQIATRFEQLCGAVMAKGAEDNAYYRANRLIGLNEVGGAPEQFGMTVEAFHAEQAWRAEHLNEPMTSLSTHDTKRSADVRARLAALSERPELFAQFWQIFTQHVQLPEPTLAWLIAQTLLASGLIEPDRLIEYAKKAAREAGVVTSWIDPSERVDDAIAAAIGACFEDLKLQAAWRTVVDELTAPARTISLGQQLVQLTMPGVPDIYQGNELLDYSLVDPDNRRLVDYGLRRQLLAALDVDPLPDLAADENGVLKLLVTQRALQLRNDRPELFSGYQPVQIDGSRSDCALGFARGGHQIVTLVTKHPSRLAARGGWAESAVELAGQWRDELTGKTHTGPQIPLAEIFSTLPVALLTKA